MAQLGVFWYGANDKKNVCHLEEDGNSENPSYTIYFNYEVMIDRSRVTLTTHWISFNTGENRKERAKEAFEILKKILTFRSEKND